METPAEFTLTDALTALWQRRVAIAAIALLGLIVGAASGISRTPTYYTTADIAINGQFSVRRADFDGYVRHLLRQEDWPVAKFGFGTSYDSSSDMGRFSFVLDNGDERQRASINSFLRSNAESYLAQEQAKANLERAQLVSTERDLAVGATDYATQIAHQLQLRISDLSSTPPLVLTHPVSKIVESFSGPSIPTRASFGLLFGLFAGIGIAIAWGIIGVVISRVRTRERLETTLSQAPHPQAGDTHETKGVS